MSTSSDMSSTSFISMWHEHRTTNMRKIMRKKKSPNATLWERKQKFHSCGEQKKRTNKKTIQFACFTFLLTQTVNVCFKAVVYHRCDDSGNVTEQCWKPNIQQYYFVSNYKFMWRVVNVKNCTSVWDLNEAFHFVPVAIAYSKNTYQSHVNK